MNEDLITQLIKDYQSTPSICKVLGVSFDRNKQKIELLALKLGLLDHLRENNKTSKKGALNLFKIHNTIGPSIQKDLEDGLSMKSVAKKYNIAKHPLKKYIVKFDLLDLVYQNKRRSDIDTLKANSQVVKQKNLYNYKYDHAIILDYAKSLANNHTKAELIRICKEKFGVSRTTSSKILQNLICKRHNNSGKNNKMYGRSPGKNSGKGASGRLVYGGYNLFFRSSLELRIFLYLINNNISFCLSNHRVCYYLDGVERTYNPDIVIGTTVYEIKPKNLKKIPINKIKFKALSEYCASHKLQCSYLDECTYDLVFFTKDYFHYMVKNGYIIVNDANYYKIIKYIKDEQNN